MNKQQFLERVCQYLQGFSEAQFEYLQNIFNFPYYQEIDDETYLEVYKEIIQSDWFYVSPDKFESDRRPTIRFTLSNKGRVWFKKLKSYTNDLKLKAMTDNNIIDFYLEKLRDEMSSLDLAQFLADNEIDFDEKRIRRLHKLIKSTEMVDDHSIYIQAGLIASFLLNGKGYKELANKKYSEYEKELSAKSNIHTINYVTHGPNSPIQTGDKGSITYNINNYDSGQISEMLDKLIEFIMEENSINTKDKVQIIKDFTLAQEQAKKGEISATIIEKVLYYADQISSIGSFLSSILLTPSGQSAMLFLKGLIV